MRKLFTPLVLVLCILASVATMDSFAREKKKNNQQPAAAASPAAPLPSPVTGTPAAPPADVRSNAPSALIDAISRVRVYVEFFYMETGEYPNSLPELERDLNSLLPRNLEPVRLPRDPATGKDFLYSVTNKGKNYTLSPPDPKAYGIDNVQMCQVPWGGFNFIVEERKNTFLKGICAENIKGLATALEYYARDNKKLPDQLKSLLSNYVRTMPTCPSCGQPYTYKTDGTDYTLSCPCPEKHGMKQLIFSSKQGWLTE